MHPSPSLNLTAFAYPRTGKRGVPQQFPRRLYEMLEVESSSTGISTMSPCLGYDTLISWSESGRAFRIADVALFAEKILPKYFRTAKFSSFQRNLNLYGFSKVRRGPDADMYAHPAFVRDRPENLVQLRKLNSAAARKSAAKALHQQQEQLALRRAADRSTKKSEAQQNPEQSPHQIAATPTRVVSPITTPTPSHRDGASSPVSFSSSLHSSSSSSSSSVDEAAVRSTYNISIPKLIQTYQQSVENKSRANSAATQYSQQDTNWSATTLPQGANKLALLAIAITTIGDR